MISKELFDEYVLLTEKIRISIIEDLSKQLELENYKDNIEINAIFPIEEFQSDCDGDNNNLNCYIKLVLKSDNSKKLFDEYTRNHEYIIRDLKVRKSNFGDEYEFNFDYYNIEEKEITKE